MIVGKSRYGSTDRRTSLFVRVIFIILGSIFLFVGVLGFILPLLPATPFLLLASACYVRGSKNLNDWLMNNKYLGPYITNIRDKRGMPRKAKIITLLVLWVSLVSSGYRVDSLVLQSTLLVVGIGVTTLIFKLKTLEES
jgi:uncharacterized membrane protein YbaN (DUF454 family)